MEHYSKDLNLAGVIISGIIHIILAPALMPSMKIPWLKKKAGMLLSGVLGSFNIPSELDVKALSRDEQVAVQYTEDPYTHGMVYLEFIHRLACVWQIKFWVKEKKFTRENIKSFHLIYQFYLHVDPMIEFVLRKAVAHL